jgi:hypothetical protein
MLLFCIACSNNTDSLKRKDTHSTKPEARSSKRQNMGHPEGTGSSGGSGSGGDTGGSSGSSGSAGSGSSGSAGSGSSGSAGSGGSGSVGSGGSSNVGSGGSGSVGSGDEVLGVSGDGKEASELRTLKKVNSTESLKEDVSSSEAQPYTVLEIGMLGEASELRTLKKVNSTESLKEDVPSSEEQPHTVLEIGSNIDTITHPDVSKKVCFYCKKPEIKERETLKSLFMKSVDWLGDFILPSVPYGPFICRECKRKSFIV